MRTFGFYIAIIGLLSIGFYFLNMNFVFLKWINHWGETTGWMIRSGLVLIGGILWYFGKKDRDH